MTTRDELRIATGEWYLLTNAAVPYTPAEAVASLAAATGDRAEAVAALYHAAGDVLGRLAHGAAMDPRATPVWDRCRAVCDYIQLRQPLLAAREVADARAAALALPTAACEGFARHERVALLNWLARAEKGLALLAAAEAAK